nr:2-oxo acid dehydrogenase subunit E2 [Streptomyces africanus]
MVGRPDTGRSEIVRLPHVHLGFAAQTDHGLVVPVVRDADRLPLGALAAELRRLTDLVRRDAVPAGHLTGGTFTLSNYGPLGVDGATPSSTTPRRPAAAEQPLHELTDAAARLTP